MDALEEALAAIVRIVRERLNQHVIGNLRRRVDVLEDHELGVGADMSKVLGAAKGHQRSQRLFADMLAKTEAANKKLNDEWFNTAIDYKLAWERELERRVRLGVDGPAPLPHPDDLVLDMQTGLVRVKGPFTKEEKEKWDFLRARKVELKEIIAENEQALRDDPDSELADEYRNEIRQDQEFLDKICTVIKD